MPSDGNAADSTALPHPPNTSQNVPRNSAAARFVKGMAVLLPSERRWAPAGSDGGGGTGQIGTTELALPRRGGDRFRAPGGGVGRRELGRPDAALRRPHHPSQH